MIDQPPKLTQDQKLWGSLFIISLGFSLCLCTPLSPAVLLEKIIIGPVITELVPPLDSWAIEVLNMPPLPLRPTLTFLFGITSGCLLTIVSFFAFVFMTVHYWRSERRVERKNRIDLQRLQVELERQRLELEKQRLELEKKRQGLEVENEERDFEI